jgi:hypothetical protein
MLAAPRAPTVRSTRGDTRRPNDTTALTGSSATDGGGVDRSRPYFFIHVMKTAGSSFQHHVTDNFPPEVRYPDPGMEWERFLAFYGYIQHLLRLTSEQHERIGIYGGHFPYVASELIGRDVVTMTILRDPVSRTISYLKHARRHEERLHDKTLEAIYEDMTTFPGYIWNHQAKVFAMTADDPLNQITDVIEIDDRRLAIAKQNLEKVDVVGLTDHFDEFLAELTDRFGWWITPHEARNVGAELPVAEDLRRQIVEDNAADVEFYEFARELHRRRLTAGDV